MAAFFPKIVDKYIRIGGIIATLGAVAGIALFSYWTYPTVLRTGYQPVQPLPYSHKLHAGNMGMDCYYCHYTVYKAAYAAIPPSQVCMNCHAKVRTESPLLEKVRDSYSERAAGSLGARPQAGGVRVFQSQRAYQFRCQLRQLSRPCGSDGGSQAGEAAQYGILPGLPPQSGAKPSSCPVRHEARLDASKRGRSGRDRPPNHAEKHIDPPVNCSGCHR